MIDRARNAIDRTSKGIVDRIIGYLRSGRNWPKTGFPDGLDAVAIRSHRQAAKRKIDIAPELIQELKRWKVPCPIGGLDLTVPTEAGTRENAANVLYRRFFPTLRRPACLGSDFTTSGIPTTACLSLRGNIPNISKASLDIARLTSQWIFTAT